MQSKPAISAQLEDVLVAKMMGEGERLKKKVAPTIHQACTISADKEED